MNDYFDLIDIQDSRIRTRDLMGKSWQIQAFDPYGLWKITKTPGGPIPAAISGDYTSESQCWEAIESYLRAQEMIKNKPAVITGSDGKGGKTKISLTD